MLSFLAADPLSHVLPHYLFNVGGIRISNQMIMAVVAAVLMVVIFPTLFRKPVTNAPRGATNFFESILEFLRVEVFRPALKQHTDRFVPFLWTIFFFILFCNLLGQIPIAEIITVFKGLSGGEHLHASHLGGTATGSIATTGALAIVTFLFIHFSGIVTVARALANGTFGHHDNPEEHSSDETNAPPAAHNLQHMRGEALAADMPGDLKALAHPTAHYSADKQGLHHGVEHIHSAGHGRGMSLPRAAAIAVPIYFWNFAPHPFKPGPGGNPIMYVLDFFMWAFLLLLELMGAAIKPIALAIRLFANMTAGHIVLAALVALIPVTAGIAAQVGVGLPVTVLSLLIRLLELFVAFLQAYIFTFLSTLFIASAVAPEH